MPESAHIRSRIKCILPFSVSACALILYFIRPVPIEFYEDRLRDLMPHVSLQLPPPATCIISLDRERWTDKDLGRLIERVGEGKAAVIAVDACPQGGEQGSGSDIDLLARGIEGLGNVIISYRFCLSPGCSAGNPSEIERSKIRFVTNPWGVVRTCAISRAEGIECASGALLRSAAGSGFAASASERERRIRRVPLVLQWGRNFYQSLDIALLAQHLKSGKVVLRLSGRTALGVELDGLFLQTDAKGTLRLRDSPSKEWPPVYSAREILNGNADPSLLKGKAVIIGETHAAQNHAVAVEDILTNRYLRESRVSLLVTVALILALPLTLSLMGGRLKMTSLTLCTLCAIGVVCGIALYLRESRSLLVSIVYPSLSVLSAWVVRLRERNVGIAA